MYKTKNKLSFITTKKIKKMKNAQKYKTRNEKIVHKNEKCLTEKKKNDTVINVK